MWNTLYKNRHAFIEADAFRGKAKHILSVTLMTLHSSPSLILSPMISY
ncbi:hypothetical protein LWM68_32915 [Niabella sp. W65]|nr:hypothetical protein [Niabella sp. W65]MCH7367136.1 hypothetical protein [Niabella sp. W65]